MFERSNYNNNNVGRRLYAGVDGRGPKPEAKICDENGIILTDNVCRGLSDIRENPVGNVADTLLGAIDNAIHIDGSVLHSSEIAGVFIAMPWDDGEHDSASLIRSLQQAWPYSGASFLVMPMMKVATENIAPSGPGLTINSGNRDREYARSLSGENCEIIASGSGQHLASGAISAVIGAIRGYLPPTFLVPRFQKHFGVRQASDLVSEFDFYNQAERTQAFADIIEIVAEEATDKDIVACQLCTQTAFAHAESSKAIINRLRIEHEHLPIGLFDGIWNYGKPFKQPYLDSVRKIAPKSYLSEKPIDIAKTAAQMAADHFGL